MEPVDRLRAWFDARLDDAKTSTRKKTCTSIEIMDSQIEDLLKDLARQSGKFPEGATFEVDFEVRQDVFIGALITVTSIEEGGP